MPRSQVSVLRMLSGSWVTWAATAAATSRGVVPVGQCTKVTNPVVRSTIVPIAEFDATLPMIRSPA